MVSSDRHVAGALREGNEIHGVVFPMDAGVGGVLDDADDLMRASLAPGPGPEKPK